MDYAPMLESMFSSVRQAVIGFDQKDMIIRFANPAAKTALGFDPAGKPVGSLIPEDIFTVEYESYLCGMAIMGRKAGFNVSRHQNITLLTIDFIEDDKPSLTITRNMISKLRNSAMGIKMSADRCFSAVESGDVPGKKLVSIFYHNYYSLLRTLLHIDSASLLERGDLPFSPVSTDLVRLCASLATAISQLFADSGVEIKFTSSEEELIAVVDPQRIEQLLLDLFANSLEHTTRGDSIDLSLSRKGKRIILSLDDTGSGIPQDVLANLFMLPSDSGELKLQKTGTGLGLYNALGIAQLHKGVLLIESRMGEGTNIRVMLPENEMPVSSFSALETSYQHKGSSTILTELSDVLTSKNYGLKYED